MANIRETATDILNRCMKRTLKKGYVATEEVLEKEFCEHLWTREFEVSGKKIVHEYFITSARSGIVRLEMNHVGPDGIGHWALLAKFHFKYLSVKAIAAAMEAIIENS